MQKDEKDFSLQVRLINACDKKGIIFYDSQRTKIYNAKTGKMKRPRKRMIKHMKPGRETWFS